MIEPELWGKNNDLTTLVNIEYIEKFKELIVWKENESIFEFGMGDGRNTKEALLPRLPKNFKEYIGSDKSATMIDYVKTNILEPRATFMVFDISSDTVPEEFENRFDHVFGFFVMHWVKNTRHAFQNMHKLLKPGGQLFLTFIDETSADPVYFDFLKHSKWSKYNHEWLISPYFNHPDPENEYKKQLVQAGFEQFEYQREKKIYKFPNEESFKGFCLSVNPVLKEVSKDEYDEYKAEYLVKMANNKLNFTKKCCETGKTLYHSSYELNAVLANKK